MNNTMIMSSNLWLMYFIIYTINIIAIIPMTAMIYLSYISQTFNSMNNKKNIKFKLFISMLSLGGLPAFLGFFPKWITIQFMAQNLMIFTSTILIMSSLLTLYYHMWMMYTTLTITNSKIIWNLSIYLKHNHSKMIIFSLCTLSFGMLVCTLILLTYMLGL